MQKLLSALDSAGIQLFPGSNMNQCKLDLYQTHKNTSRNYLVVHFRPALLPSSLHVNLKKHED